MAVHRALNKLLTRYFIALAALLLPCTILGAGGTALIPVRGNQCGSAILLKCSSVPLESRVGFQTAWRGSGVSSCSSHPLPNWLSWLHCSLPLTCLPGGMNSYLKIPNLTVSCTSRTNTNNSLDLTGLNWALAPCIFYTNQCPSFCIIHGDTG